MHLEARCAKDIVSDTFQEHRLGDFYTKCKKKWKFLATTQKIQEIKVTRREVFFIPWYFERMNYIRNRIRHISSANCSFIDYIQFLVYTDFR